MLTMLPTLDVSTVPWEIQSPSAGVLHERDRAGVVPHYVAGDDDLLHVVLRGNGVHEVEHDIFFALKANRYLPLVTFLKLLVYLKKKFKKKFTKRLITYL